MGGGHRGATDRHHLYEPGDTLVHRLSAPAKLVGLLLFTVAVALTPRRAVAVFAADAVALAAVVTIARLGLRLILTRLAVVTPFLVVAVLLPFLSEGGPQVTVAGLSLSADGSWAAWNIVAKATLGATAAIVVSATTPLPELIAGLGRLRVPAVVVAIVAFMFRYLDLLADQLQRMRNAMVARGHDPRWLWQVRPIAGSAGALFVRSYERGERVHQAMAARGYTGAMPVLNPHRSGPRDALAAAPGIAASVGLVAALVAS